jgi:DNA polymerase
MSSEELSVNLNAQLLAHAESLRAAGITLIARGPALDLPQPKMERSPLSLNAKPEGASNLPGALANSPSPISKTAPPSSPPLVEAKGRDLLEVRRQALTVLATEISGCELCSELFATRTQTVFGVGPVDPEVAFVGEAPGADEDREGEPFVGRAGQLLTKIILASGFTRPEVYILNILKCRPPSNRVPTSTECTNCRAYFERQFDLVNPKFVVALGVTAAKNLLGINSPIGKLRGQVFHYRDRPLICTYHPSALLRDPSGGMKRACWEDMKFLLKTMGRPIPEVNRK